MSDLIVVGFQNKFEAEEALLALRKMEKEHLIDLEDAAIVVKNEKGKVNTETCACRGNLGALPQSKLSNLRI